jgi:hypothetical protein
MGELRGETDRLDGVHFMNPNNINQGSIYILYFTGFASDFKY